jgi:methyl-accepting chemotaxis protein
MATIRELRARFTASAQGFTQAIQSVNQGMEQIGETGQESSEKANDGFAKLKDTLIGFAGAYLGFEAIKGAVGGVIGITDEYQKALNTLETQSGATKDEMTGMEESLKNIYANNYGESFDDIAQSMALVQNNTGLTGKELEKTTQNAILLRDTFEFDIAQSTQHSPHKSQTP